MNFFRFSFFETNRAQCMTVHLLPLSSVTISEFRLHLIRLNIWLIFRYWIKRLAFKCKWIWLHVTLRCPARDTRANASISTAWRYERQHRSITFAWNNLRFRHNSGYSSCAVESSYCTMLVVTNNTRIIAVGITTETFVPTPPRVHPGNALVAINIRVDRKRS